MGRTNELRGRKKTNLWGSLLCQPRLVVTLPACGVLHATIGVAQGAAWGAMGGMPNCALRLAHPESALGDAE